MSQLPAFGAWTVLVVGDVMLDEYIHGRVHRISPEAPVPILALEGRRWHAGGAANVAVNIAGLGGQVLLAGVVGADPAAARLRARLTSCRVSTHNLVTFADCRTTTKTRVVCGAHQIVRIDDEQTLCLSRARHKAFADTVAEGMRQADVCVISDYGKGLVTPAVCRAVIEGAAARGIPVVADPKGTDFTKYSGATLLTPNLSEARAAAGSLQAEEEGEDGPALDRMAQAILGCCDTGLLITRGAAGMRLYERGQAPFDIEAQARQVYDVTGAGDTVIATVALGLAAGLPLRAACRLGNLAAGVVVGQPGVAAIAREALQAVLRTKHIDDYAEIALAR